MAPDRPKGAGIERFHPIQLFWIEPAQLDISTSGRMRQAPAAPFEEDDRIGARKAAPLKQRFEPLLHEQDGGLSQAKLSGLAQHMRPQGVPERLRVEA